MLIFKTFPKFIRLIENPMTENSTDKNILPRVIYALFLGILMALFTTVVKMITGHNFLLSMFYSSGSLGMFTAGFFGGLLFGNPFKKRPVE